MASREVWERDNMITQLATMSSQQSGLPQELQSIQQYLADSTTPQKCKFEVEFNKLLSMGEYLLGVTAQSIHRIEVSDLERSISVDIGAEITSVSESGGKIVVVTSETIHLLNEALESVLQHPVSSGVAGAIVFKNQLVYLEYSGTLHALSLGESGDIRSKRCYKQEGTAISTFEGSHQFATMGDSGLIYLWDSVDSQIDREKGFADALDCQLTWGDHLLTSSKERNILRIWTKGSTESVFDLDSAYKHPCVTSDGELLFLYGRKLKMFNLKTKRFFYVPSLSLFKQIRALTVTVDCKWLFVFSGHNLYKVQLIEDLKPEVQAQCQADIRSFAEQDTDLFLAQGRTLIGFTSVSLQREIAFNSPIQTVHASLNNIFCVLDNEIKIVPPSLEGDFTTLSYTDLTYVAFGKTKFVTITRTTVTVWSVQSFEVLQSRELEDPEEFAELDKVLVHSAEQADVVIARRVNGEVVCWKCADLSLVKISEEAYVDMACFNLKAHLLLVSEQNTLLIVDADSLEVCTGEIPLPINYPGLTSNLTVTKNDKFCLFTSGSLLHMVSLSNLVYLGALNLLFNVSRLIDTPHALCFSSGDKVYSVRHPCVSSSSQIAMTESKYTFVLWESILLFFSSSKTMGSRAFEENLIGYPQITRSIILPNMVNFLHLFALIDHSKALKYALKLQCPILRSTNEKSTPLGLAMRSKSNKSINTILKWGARQLDTDPNVFRRFEQELGELNGCSVQNLSLFYDAAFPEPQQELPRIGKPLQSRMFFASPSLRLKLEQFLDPSTIPKKGSAEPPLEASGINSLMQRLQTQTQTQVRDNGQLIQFKVSAFRINLTAGSSESIQFLQSLLDSSNPSIFVAPLIQALLEYKWKNTKWFLMLQALFHVIFMLILCVYIAEGAEAMMMLNLLFVLNLVSVAIELTQIAHSFWRYLIDVWNLLDLFRIIFVIVYYVIKLDSGYGMLARILLAVVMLLTWIRAVAFFRIFQTTRYLIRMIIEIVRDMIPFLIVLFYAIAGFALIFFVLRTQTDQNFSFGDGWTHAFMMGFGDFNTDDYNAFEWVAFFLCSIGIPLILMNMLIALMGTTYERVQDSYLEADLQEKASFILEYETLLWWRREVQVKHYFQYCSLEDRVSALDEDVWEGKAKILSNRIKELTANVDQIYLRNKESNQLFTELLQSIRESIESNVAKMKTDSFRSRKALNLMIEHGLDGLPQLAQQTFRFT